MHNQLFGAIHKNQYMIIKQYLLFKSVKKQCTQKITDEHRAGISCLTQLGQIIYESYFKKESSSYPYNFMSSLLISCLWNRGPMKVKNNTQLILNEHFNYLEAP